MRSAPKSTPTVSPLAATIDRVGYLLAEQQRAKPWLKELDALKAELQKECEDLPADQPVRLEGNLYYVDLSARENRREITDKSKAWAALKKAIGLDKLIAALSIPFKVLDSAIPAEAQVGYVKTERTGSRDISAGLRSTPTVMPKAA